MARPDSWMPVYWGDLWNDTRDLTAVEQCAYYNLLGSMWMEGGSLPNDNDRLQRMSRVTEKEWRTVNATVTAYFDRGEDGRLYQKRLSEEYAKAMKAYTARSQHMATVNSHRKQSPSTVTVTRTVDTTNNSQSPNGETEAKASVAKPRKPRRTRLATDWQPSAEDHSIAVGEGLTAAEIAADLAEWREYWNSSEPRDPTKGDWSRTYRNHVKQFAAGIIARRPRQGQPTGYRSGPASVLAAGAAVVSRMEALAGFRPDGSGDLEGATTHGGGASDGADGGADGQIIDGTCEAGGDRGATHADAHGNQDAA